MAQVPADLRVCIFDVFGTVVDWRGSLIEDLPKLGAKYGLDTDWTSFADDWRGLYQPQMSRVRKGEIPWTNIDELHKEAFETLLLRLRDPRGIRRHVVEPRARAGVREDPAVHQPADDHLRAALQAGGEQVAVRVLVEERVTAGAQEDVDLRLAHEAGEHLRLVHPRTDRQGHVRPEGGDQPHRQRPQDQHIDDVKKAGTRAAGPRVGRIGLRHDGGNFGGPDIQPDKDLIPFRQPVKLQVAQISLPLPLVVALCLDLSQRPVSSLPLTPQCISD